MPSFYNLTSGTVAQAQDVQQLISALNGTAGLGVPLSPTAVNDSVNFALAVKNLDTTNSRALQVVRANNTVLLQADVNGLIGSVDGTTAPAQLVNVSLAQTLSNKTLSNIPVVGVGTAPNPNFLIKVAGTPTGNTTEVGVGSQPTGDSSGTTELSAFYGNPTTAAAAYTVASAICFHATPIAKGAGSTITSAYGMLVDSQSSGTTNNYGVFITAASGGSGDNVSLVAQGGALIGGASVPAKVGYIGFGTVTAAPGGGSAATLATIGGSGPTTAAQNGWLKISVNGSNAFLAIWQ